MHTYRDGDNWSAAQWPADAGEGDVTTWTYDEATGLLTAKTYADGQGVSYTYETGGNLNTRTWARTVGGAPLVTTYDYDPATGELTGIDYSDETPDIAFTYDRAGRKETVADAAGNRTFIYDGVKLDMEIITGIYDRTIDYDYETAGVGMAGRPAGFSVGSDYLVEYGYESGRISGLNWQIGTHTGGAGYTYQDGLIHQLQFQNGPTVSYTYDPVERYKTRVKNENASGVISQYDYTHDILGRRETVTYSGSAFTQGPTYRRFAYNDRSELIESSAYAGSDIADTSSPMPPEYRSYAYDPIGNRTTATDWDEAADASQVIDYAANELNQYDQITTGAETDLPEYDADGNLTRISSDDPLMTYNGENRLVEAEYQVATGDLTGEGAVDLTDAISALQVAAGMTPSGVTTDGDIDDDGQIGIEEAVYALQVVAEMRMPAETSRKLVMAYDYMGRRVSKETFSRNESDTDWNLTPDKTVLFVYDGWNLVEEIEQRDTGESSRYYVWGLDLSQSFDGAGGIGGLLASVDRDSSFRYLYDGNGNVGQLVGAEDGEFSAYYEYDPYGNVIDSYGEYAVVNPFRFSTKYFFSEIEDYDFGLRMYLPKVGRWSSRDPINEEGGFNLYGFVHNSPLFHIDPFGLKIYFAIYWIDNEGSFQKAAETWKRSIESSSDFRPNCDFVFLFPVKTEFQFIEEWEHVKTLADAVKELSPSNYKIKEGVLFTHAGKDEDEINMDSTLYFTPDYDSSGDQVSDGSFRWVDTKILSGLPWLDDGKLILRGCRSGLAGLDNVAMAEAFAYTQGVETQGEVGFAYFSENSDRYIRINVQSKDVYLKAYKRRLNGLWGDGTAMEPEVYDPNAYPPSNPTLQNNY